MRNGLVTFSGINWRKEKDWNDWGDPEGMAGAVVGGERTQPTLLER